MANYLKVQPKLIFGKGNAKLDKKIKTFSLPAGYTCPGANECLSRANRKTGKITDGPNTQFRCFSASQEALFPAVRKARWENFTNLKGQSLANTITMLNSSLPKNTTAVRIHVSGDFFSQDYFDAWLEVAKLNSGILFYAYTKALDFWVARLDRVGTGRKAAQIPNFVLTASYGGRYDELIAKHNLRSAKVVFSEAEAAVLGLKIDHDDGLAMKFGCDFGLLIHGVNPKGSEAMKAVIALKGIGSYGKPKSSILRSLPVTTHSS